MTTTLPPVPFVDLSVQNRPIEDELKQAVWSTIQRGDFILGQAVHDFEHAFASACGTSFGIGVGCGTDAIALGLQAAGIGRGDEVILPVNTFIATLLGVLRTGATPILVDCDPNTALIDLIAVEKAITPRTRAIIPVHLYGQMVSPHALRDLARTYDLIIFEDAAQAHLAEREGQRAGSIGVAAAFSFYPSKNLGGFGDGGILVTGDETIARVTRSLRNYGAPRKYYHTDLGTNSRLDTLQAAVLSAKLPHLPSWNRDRHRIAQRYDTWLEPLRNSGIMPMTNESGSGHVYHLYVIRITDCCRLDRDTLQTELAAQGIQTGIHYPVPCHLQPAFHHLGYVGGDFPKAEMLCQEVLSLPLYPGMTDAQIFRVVSTLRDLINPAANIDPTATNPTSSNTLVAG
ncbi:MAG: DegT/DnrJ/EryC1/StrS family aminotransferase [Elainellaceae cyanobacterium]